MTRSAQLFGCHVCRRPERRDQRGISRVICPLDELADPQIQHLHELLTATVPRHEQIGWLEIAMNDPSAVRFCDRVTRLQYDRGRDRYRHRTALSQPCRQIDAIEVLHDDTRR